MKILFVVSGNSSQFEITPFIKRQADSIVKNGHEIDYFKIIGKGTIGYLGNIQGLKKKINSCNYDLIHAHYSFNGLLSLLTGTKVPIIVSYMGSDVYGDYNKQGKLLFSSLVNITISIIIQPFVNAIIVKSQNLTKKIFRNKYIFLIPNGIDLSIFKENNRKEARSYLGLKDDEKVVLFMGDKYNQRKNFNLIKDAIEYLPQKPILLTPYPVSPDKTNIYYNAADLLALTSFNEGSPNVIKEAMACNCPIVATEVGDIQWLFGNEPGHYITSFDSEDVAEKIANAFQFRYKYGRTNGRERLINLGLDSDTIAMKIIGVYKDVVKKV